MPLTIEGKQMTPLVYKTFGAEMLDDFYSGDPQSLREAYDKGRGLMRENTRLAEAARPLEQDEKLPEGSADEFDQYYKDGEEVIRAAYEDAIELAHGQRPPK